MNSSRHTPPPAANALSPEALMGRLEREIALLEHALRLQDHVRLLLDKGGLYKVYNGNLLFHGSIPLNEDGSLKEVEVYGETYKGKQLYDVVAVAIRRLRGGCHDINVAQQAIRCVATFMAIYYDFCHTYADFYFYAWFQRSVRYSSRT